MEFADRGIVIASDVCTNLIQLGSVYAKYKLPVALQKGLGFLTFDAFNPPLEPRQFDGVVMFSALHHFPDPTGFLKRLRDMIRDDGFVGVYCEPCDPSATGGEDYIRDLSAGVNEQIFSIAEYEEIFRSSGLKSIVLQDDGGSLKAILEPA